MATLVVYADTADNTNHYSSTTWATIHGAATASYQDASTNEHHEVGASFFTPDYYADQCGLPFDTSALPDGATIDDAVLAVYGKVDASTIDDTLEVAAFDFGPSYDLADWQTRTELAAHTILATRSMAGFSVAGYNDFTNTGAGLKSIINKTGTTRIIVWPQRLRNGTPTGSSYVEFWSADEVQTGERRPRLTITYTEAAEAPATGVQHGQNLGSTGNGTVGQTSTVLSPSSKTVTVGNHVAVAWGCYHDITATSVTDNLGNTYTRVERIRNATGATAEMWDALVTTGGAITTITVAHASTQYVWLTASEVTGAASRAPAPAAGLGASASTPAVWCNGQIIPAKGMVLGMVTDSTNGTPTAGAASGTPSRTITQVLFHDGGGDESGSLSYATAGDIPVSGFTGTTANAVSSFHAGAGAIYSPVWGASGWEPTAIPDLLLWLDADSLALADAAAVASWTDRSGLNHHYAQATGSMQPLYDTGASPNGRAGVLYGDTDSLQNLESVTLAPQTTGMSLFTVIRPSGDGSLSGTGSYMIYGEDNNNGFFYYPTGDELELWAEPGASVMRAGATNTIPGDTTGLAELIWPTSGAAQVWHNGTAVGSPAAAFTPSNTTQWGRYLGEDNFAECFIGHIFAVIVVAREVTAAERAKIEGYLAWRYGIESSLPSGHPWKTVDPGAAGVYAAKILALPSLRFAYPLDAAGTVDIGPNGLTLTAAAIPGMTPLAPVIGYDATSYNGSTQYHSRAHVAAFNFGLSDFTVGCWVKPTDVAAGSRFFLCHDGDNGSGSWEMWQSANNLNSRMESSSVSAAGVLDTTWQFVAVVMDRDGNGRWWRNGGWAHAGNGISAHVAVPMDYTGSLYIGRRQSTGYFPGSIAWAFGCAAALTETELLALYDARDDALAMVKVHPDADVTTTGWATAPLWSKVEEAVADGTVITATSA